MYKLHYDVGAGKQFNVSYKGVEFEVQAGLGGDVEVEMNKTVTLSENGTVEIIPSSGKDAMAKVTATVNVPIPPEAEIEDNKTVTITTNGTHEITPSIDKDAMAKVTAMVNVPTGPDVNVQDWKYYEVTRNGSQDVTPDSGYDAMRFVQLDVSVPSPDIESNKTVTLTQNGTVEITPSIDKDAMAKVTATVNVPPPLDGAIWFGSKAPTSLDPTGGGSYMYSGTTPLSLSIDPHVPRSQTSSVLNVEGSNLELMIGNPSFKDGYGRMNVPNLLLQGNDYVTKPIYRLVVTGVLSASRDFSYGSTDPSSPCIIDVYGRFDMGSYNVTLRNCRINLYTNDINVLGTFSDYSETEKGEIHVLIGSPVSEIGGHFVIKNLFPD